MLSDEDQAEARQMFKEHPHMFPEQNRPAILAGRIVVGMSPLETKLAGGGFTYQIKADPKRWPAQTHPMAVLGAQSTEPDDSEIVLTFRNRTQYPGQPQTTFQVEFFKGRVSNIQPVSQEQS